MDHIFKDAPALEYIANYDAFSLNYDKEYSSEIEFIQAEINYFLDRIDYYQSKKYELKKEIDEGQDKSGVKLIRQLETITIISSLEDKVKFLQKKICILGYSYEITDNKITLISTAVSNDDGFLKELTSENNDLTPKNYLIFINNKAFKLFSHLYEGFSSSNNQLANFSFIYWKMYNDKLIYQNIKPESFRQWLHENYEDISISSVFKTLNRCTTIAKESLYNSAKAIYKV